MDTSKQKVLFLSAQNIKTPIDGIKSYKEALIAIGNNSGNMVFTHALQYYLEESSTPYEVSSDAIYLKTLSKKDFSCCIVNCSNWLEPKVAQHLSNLTQVFKETEIPVFFIGLGIQSCKSNPIDFPKEFHNVAKDFIKSVLKTGGGFGLRGHHTADYFNHLGFTNEYTVTGCPSLYHNGPQFEISDYKVPIKDFHPVFNGSDLFNSNITSELLNQYKKSVFIDQDLYFKFLKYSNEFEEKDLRNFLANPQGLLNAIIRNQLVLFTDFKEWSQYLNNNKYNFSFGSRFHGNVVSILNGIPALVNSMDKRVGELTEFFGIPVNTNPFSHTNELYDKYLSTNYSTFNQLYPKRFQEFQNFINLHHLPLKLPTQPLNVGQSDTIYNPQIDNILISTIKSYTDFKPIQFLLPYIDRRKQFFIFKRPFTTIKSLIS